MSVVVDLPGSAGTIANRREPPLSYRAPPMSTPRAAFVSGAADIAPILLGVFPFGVIAGLVAVDAGLNTLQAILASPLIFAGASQLATMDLIARDAAPVVIVATALVINARFAMYSAALSPWFRGLGPLRTSAAAYVLTDQAFAAASVRYGSREEDLPTRYAYYMGGALALWVTWQISSVIGVIVGTGVPPEWSLDFAIPLVFMALVVPAIKDRGTATAAVAAGIAAAVFEGLPLHLGLLAAAGTGILAGLIAERTR